MRTKSPALKTSSDRTLGYAESLFSLVGY